MSANWLVVRLFVFYLVFPLSAFCEVFVADPAAGSGDANYYKNLVSQLQPGDTLQLPAGTYTPSSGSGLYLNGINGTESAWITITGPESGPPAIIQAGSTCCNNVQMGDNSYLELKNLTIDSASLPGIDGINTKDGLTHDILIENCIIQGVGDAVGLNTKHVAYNWTIRGNSILNADTGMYLANPDGGGQFINGVIENNLIVDSVGYNIQIKRQNDFDTASWFADLPPAPRTTIIRNNVFMKSQSTSRARPNLLLGGFPETGSSVNDLYQVYGNFFYRNFDDTQIQATTRVAIHDNIFVGGRLWAIRFISHQGRQPKFANVYNNTIYNTPEAIRFSSTLTESGIVRGNAIFADTAIGGNTSNVQISDNITDSIANASNYVQSPSETLGTMNFFPRAGMLEGSAIDLSPFSSHVDYNVDFNGTSKGSFTYRGAYAGSGTNPGWQLDGALKQGGSSGGPGDSTTPNAPSSLRFK